VSIRFNQRGLTAWGALVVAVVALVWLVRLFASRGPEVASAAPSHGSPGAAANAAPTPDGAPAPGEGLPHEEKIPVPGCWDGLLAFDQQASMENFRGMLAQAVSKQDRELATYLQERLTELVGNDPQRALTVIDWAEQARQPELGVYLDALRDAAAVHRPEVVDRLVKMGENPKLSLVNRGVALTTLETQRKLDAPVLQRLQALALDERIDEVAWTATRTIGRVMKEDFERTGTYRPYWDKLLEVGQKSDDTAVRLLALEMPSYSNPIIDSASVDKLSRIMKTDRDGEVREMAAFRLAVTEDPQKSLEAYRTAFESEQELCVRWAIFRFAVRAGGASALPMLQAFAAKEPRLAQDYQEFKDLYASGTVDFVRVWQGKPEHIQCNVD